MKVIKFGDTYDIAKEGFESEIDINDLFKEEDSTQIKEDIYTTIKSHSLDGTGIRFTKLIEIILISEVDLRSYLKDLMEESRIYQSEKEVYQTF